MEIKRYEHIPKYNFNCHKLHSLIKVVDNELKTLGVLDELTSSNLSKLTEIPVDIRPCYPLAGEEC